MSCAGNFKTLYELGNDGCNATQNLITFSWDLRNPLFPEQTIFDFSVSIFNHFYNKIVSTQRNIHSKHISYTVPAKGGFLEGNFCLCVENVIRVLDAFFLHIKSWCRKALHIQYKVSAVILRPNTFCTYNHIEC